MRRSALALLGLIALPLAASAQTGERLTTEDRPLQLPNSTWAVTPFVGVRVPFTTGDFVVTTESGRQFAYREERAGGAMVGLQVERRLAGPFRLVAAAAYSGSGETTYEARGSTDGTLNNAQIDGPVMYLVRAGVGYRLPEPRAGDDRRYHPSAMVAAAPAVVWLNYDDVDGFPDLGRTTRHLGLNLSAEATSRLGSGPLAVSLGLDGMVTFWDFDELRPRDELLFGALFEEAASVDYDYSNSLILLARLGLSYRF